MKLRAIGSVLASLAISATAASFAAPAQAADSSGVKLGVLTCSAAGGWGFIFGSSREVQCTFAPTPDRVERYKGSINKFGVDVGYQRSGVLVWTVVAPTTDVAPGALAGSYGGVSATATAGVGVGANALVGGLNRSISLQPVSIEGTTGLNVAAGIGGLNLTYVPGM